MSPADPSQAPALEAKLAYLRDPRTYPVPPQRLDVIETHMSWVFLADALVYKLKKPVRYDFLDYRSLAARAHSCAEEVRLNRALAPDVYLGVVPLALSGQGDVRLEGQGTPIEWLVKMRRLPAARMLDNLIAAGVLREADIRRVAGVLAGFYRSAGRVPIEGEAYRARLAAMVALNRRVLATADYRLPAERVARVHDALAATLTARASLYERRAKGGHIVEGHGDLRPEHVCLEDARPVVFDRLEFNRRLREVDPADELAFLAMECERLGERRLGPLLFDAYGAATGDVVPEVLVPFYMAHRACIRARLAVLHTLELDRTAWPRWLGKADGYLRLADGYCRMLTAPRL